MVVDSLDDLAVHLDQAPVRVVREPGVARRGGQPFDSDVVEPQVEDRVHHPGHRDRRSRADRDEQRLGRVAEALARVLLEPLDVLADLLVEPGGDSLARSHVGAAGIRGDREPGGDGDAERGHLREPDALAAEQLAAPGALVEVEDVAHDAESSTCSAVRVWNDAVVNGHVVAMGGFHETLVRFAIGLAGSERPRVLYVPTAVAEDPWWIADFHEKASGRGIEPDQLRLFGSPDDPLGRIERADVILVNGGNTANMLAVWRVHGVDRAIRAAWERGAVLAGWSAGGNCWFESSVTDSFRVELDPLHDGLALLAGSFCPHYDAEEERRPVYERLVRERVLPPGLACDDAASLHYVGTELVEAVSGTPGARAWRVTEQGSAPIETRPLA